MESSEKINQPLEDGFNSYFASKAMREGNLDGKYHKTNESEMGIFRIGDKLKVSEKMRGSDFIQTYYAELGIKEFEVKGFTADGRVIVCFTDGKGRTGHEALTTVEIEDNTEVIEA